MKKDDTNKGRLLPWAIVAFFLVVMAVNGVFLYLAFDSHPGVETEGAYEKGLDYNTALAGAEINAAIGWQVDVTAQWQDNQGTDIALIVKDENGTPLERLVITGLAIFPVMEGHDQSFQLTDTGDGAYVATVALDYKGQWDLRFVLIGPDGRRFQYAKRVLL